MSSSEYTESGVFGSRSLSQSDIVDKSETPMEPLRNVKYVVNNNFNARVEKSADSPFVDNSGKEDPLELLGSEKWSFQENNPPPNNGNWWLSENLDGTVLQSPDKSAVPAWKRYAQMAAQQQNDDSGHTDTFGKRKQVAFDSTADESSAKSPLKLFDKKLDTYTTNRFEQLLGGLDLGDEGKKDQESIKEEPEDANKWADNADVLFKNLKTSIPVLHQENTNSDGDYTSDSEAQPKLGDHSSFNSDDYEVSEKVPGSFSSNASTSMESQDAVPMSVIEEESPPKVRGLNHISPDEYKGKVYDVQRKVWVPQSEVAANSNDDEVVEAINGISDLQVDSDKENELKTKKLRVAKKDSRLRDVTNVSQADVSFSGAHETWRRILTQTDPHKAWDRIRECNLSSQGLQMMKDFDQFAPNVEKLDISDNQLKFIEGIPQKTKWLDASANEIGDLTPFSHLPNLNELFLKGNTLSHFMILSSVTNLYQLDVSHNKVRSLRGLENLTSLFVLRMSDNELEGTLDFSGYNLRHLKVLDVSRNRITRLKGLEALSTLVQLKADQNRISEIASAEPLRIRDLSLSENNLSNLDVSQMPVLDTLNIDGNKIRSLIGCDQVPLRELSARCLADCADVFRFPNLERLDLSASAGLEFSKIRYGLRRLRYLNLSSTSLKKIPTTFAQRFPVLEELNLNYNDIRDLSPLKGMDKLVKLAAVANQVASLSDTIRDLWSSRRTLEWLDLRLNGFNREFYPFVFEEHELASSGFFEIRTLEEVREFEQRWNSYASEEGRLEWVERDEQHVRKLSAEVLHKRRDMLSVMIGALKRVKHLDGHTILSEDRDAALAHTKTLL